MFKSILKVWRFIYTMIRSSFWNFERISKRFRTMLNQPTFPNKVANERWRWEILIVKIQEIFEKSYFSTSTVEKIVHILYIYEVNIDISIELIRLWALYDSKLCTRIQKMTSPFFDSIRDSFEKLENWSYFTVENGIFVLASCKVAQFTQL